MTDLIRVIVYLPSIRMRREIAVSPKMMVSDLKKYLPNPDFELVFQGGMLFGHHTLDSCAVRNGACLIVPNSPHQRILSGYFFAKSKAG